MKAVVLLCLVVLPLSSAQQPNEPEEEAFVVPSRAETPREVLLIMAMARTLAEIEPILPELAQREARRLYKSDRDTLLEELALGMLGRREGYTVKVGKEQGVIAYAEKDGRRQIDLRVYEELIAGDTAVVIFGLKETGEASGWLDSRVQGWMKHEDGGWRLLHLVEAKLEMSLNEPEFFDAVREKALKQREQAAAEFLGKLHSAFQAYGAAFPERALPLDLDPVLKAWQKQQDTVFAIPVTGDLKCRRRRCMGNGYNFEYEPTGAGYVLTARPSRYGLSGVLSFSVTESGDLRCTPDERVPGDRDPAVKSNSLQPCRSELKDEAPPAEQPQPE